MQRTNVAIVFAICCYAFLYKIANDKISGVSQFTDFIKHFYGEMQSFCLWKFHKSPALHC